MWKVTLQGLARAQAALRAHRASRSSSASRSCRARSCSPSTIQQDVRRPLRRHLSRAPTCSRARHRARSRVDFGGRSAPRVPGVDCSTTVRGGRRCRGRRRRASRSPTRRSSTRTATRSAAGRAADVRLRAGPTTPTSTRSGSSRAARPPETRRRDRRSTSASADEATSRSATASTVLTAEAAEAVHDRRASPSSAPPTARLGASIVAVHAAGGAAHRGTPPTSSATSASSPTTGVSQEELRDRIARSDRSVENVEVVTGDELTEENQDDVEQLLGFFNIASDRLRGRSRSSSACFIIYNTFSIVVAQRTREMALLRAIGASARPGAALGARRSRSWSASSRPRSGSGSASCSRVGLKALLDAVGLRHPGRRHRDPAERDRRRLRRRHGRHGRLGGRARARRRRASRRSPRCATSRSSDRPSVGRRLVHRGRRSSRSASRPCCVGLFAEPDNASAFVGVGALADLRRRRSCSAR